MPEFIPTHPDQVGLREHIETLLVSLRQETERRFIERDARFVRDEKWIEESVKTIFSAMGKLDEVMLERLASARREVDLANSAQQLAVDKAESATEKRLDLMNQFREQINHQSLMFATRESVEEKFVALDKLIDTKSGTNTERISRLESKSSNLDGRFWAIGATIVVVNLLIALGGLFLRGFNV